MSKFLLVTKGTAGDVVPFLAIGTILKAAGHQIRLFTHPFYAASAHKAGLEFSPLGSAADFDSFIEDGPLLETPLGITKFADKHVLPSTMEEFALIRAHCDPGGTVIVGRYMADIAAQMVSEKFGVPLLRIYTAVAQVLTRRLFAQICAERLATKLNHLRDQAGLPQVIDWQGWIDTPRWNAGTWPGWFAETDSSWPSGFEALGFLTFDAGETGDLPLSVIDILDSNKLPVLITGGTAKWSLANRFYQVAAEASALAGVTALLVTRFRELVTEPLPPTVHWFPQLPFGSLIPRVRAVIHHGGTSVLVRGLKAGVPSLLLPFGADRPDTAARVVRLGVARSLKPGQWQPGAASQALRELIDSANVKTACLRVADKFREEGPESKLLIYFQSILLP